MDVLALYMDDEPQWLEYKDRRACMGRFIGPMIGVREVKVNAALPRCAVCCPDRSSLLLRHETNTVSQSSGGRMNGQKNDGDEI